MILGSQCLEIGKDCSGYRTTLTWGVGVASRGKLRGLSLPIANSNASAKTSNGIADPKPQSSPSKQFTSSPTKSHEHDGGAKVDEGNYLDGFGQSTDINTTNFATTGIPPSGPIPIPTSAPGMGWHVPGFNEHLEGYSALSGKPDRLNLRPRPLQRLCTTSIVPYEDSVFSAPSTGSVSNFSDSDYGSPTEFPQSPDEVPLAETFINRYSDRFMYHDVLHTPETYKFVEAPRSYPVTTEYIASSVGSDLSTNGSAELYSPPSEYVGPTSLADILRPSDLSTIEEVPSQIPMNGTTDTEYFGDGYSTTITTFGNEWGVTIPRSVDPTSFNHLSPRMQFLLNYYDKAICPVLVAFDGPTNPYRQYILHLAVSNKALQNAIAALSTNNLRMRGLKELQRYGNESVDHLTADEIRDMHSDPTPEELRYKSTSVQLFNSSLKTALSAADDSNLATLLVLCLYHVCDSGFSKFKTQLAGVQKLLCMRDRRNGISEFVGWIQMFFTWFDVMTSTVNDREAQVRCDAFDMLNLSANLGALEHLAGCEGRLFKLIAQLGRLNLLSQNRPVRDTPAASQMRTPRPSPGVKPASKDYYSLDGNGWGSPVTLSPSAAFAPDALLAAADSRHEFWTEWHYIRARLAAWEADPAGGGGPSPVGSDADNAEIQHISESFRHAALLYTERLGSPHLPASAPQLQALVATALRHIAAIPVASCVNKFLLWPVFIVGAECVRPADRATIRMRCVEIMKESGFFNNLSGLEVLERVWAEDDAADGCAFVQAPDGADAPMLSALGGQAFRWRRAMVRVDGEYIVV